MKRRLYAPIALQGRYFIAFKSRLTEFLCRKKLNSAAWSIRKTLQKIA